MSGFEVAGIALAVFPILVDGLVRFVDGVQTIKHWRRYRVRLQDYADRLTSQKVYYEDTLEELLEGLVQSEDELTDLLAQPRGIIWKKPEYEAKLRQRLGRSHETYLRTSDKMVNALYAMCEGTYISGLLPVILAQIGATTHVSGAGEPFAPPNLSCRLGEISTLCLIFQVLIPTRATLFMSILESREAPLLLKVDMIPWQNAWLGQLKALSAF